MSARARQGLLPFRMEAAARPMDLTAQAGLTLVAETLTALGVEDLVRGELRLGQRRRGFSPYEIVARNTAWSVPSRSGASIRIQRLI
jgi:hypothetical protein